MSRIGSCIWTGSSPGGDTVWKGYGIFKRQSLDEARIPLGWALRVYFFLPLHLVLPFPPSASCKCMKQCYQPFFPPATMPCLYWHDVLYPNHKPKYYFLCSWHFIIATTKQLYNYYNIYYIYKIIYIYYDHIFLVFV